MTKPLIEFSFHRDPTVVEVNRLPMRPSLLVSESIEGSRRSHSSRRAQLDGAWRFRLFDCPDDIDDTHFRGSTSKLSSVWRKVLVPGNWTMQGVGDHPQYTNIDMPFDGPPPRIPEENPTGVYRRTFSLPATWLDKQVVLHIGAADSVHYVYVNRKFVGYGTDSHLASEYDISRFVKRGSNELAVVVVRYSAQSYVEDQDQWWMAGLHRSVFIEARSVIHVRSVNCLTDYDAVTGHGAATIEVDVSFVKSPQPGVSVQLWFEEISGRRVSESVICEVPHDYLQRYTFIGHRVTAKLSIPNIRPWSAEDPHRYRLIVKLIGPVREYVSILTGFRRIRVEHGEVRVNNRRVTIMGVNRHDHHPDRGKAVTADDMRADIMAMKRHNCNAVRTSHYPNSPEFLDLCDEYGLYVVAEANIESHAYNTSLCNDDRYLATWMSRGMRMVVRDLHHPSAVFWSLGNESGFGTNHDALASLIRSLDPTRPLHYEGAIFHERNGDTQPWRNGGRNATDVVCPMYPPIPAIVDYARSGADRPLVMCEYSHAMGNSNGSLADYWTAIDDEPLLAGGFVWEWKDHGLRQRIDPRKNATGSTWRFAYGGQFGDVPNDGNFVADGLNSSDLIAHPAMRELAWVHRPVAVSRASDDSFTVKNRRSHVGISDLHGTVSLLVGGETIHEEELSLDVEPLSQVTMPFSAGVRNHLASAPTHATITLQFRWMLRSNTSYAEAGHLVAWDEIMVRAPQPKTPPLDRMGFETRELLGETADACFAEPVRLALMRAPIDNDGYKVMPGFGELHRIGGRSMSRWKRLGILTDAIPPSVQHVQQREVRRDGGVVYRHRVVIPEPLTGLPRIGVRFALPAEFGFIRWFGRGPHENYPDRSAAALRDVWARVPDSQPYLVPQEFGLRTECEWIEFVADTTTVRIDVLEPATLHFSAVHHTPLQLFEALDATQLVTSENLIVHLDVAHRGLGTASCGPDVLPHYEVPAGTFEFSYLVRRT